MEPCFQFPQQNWKNLSRHLKPVPVTSPGRDVFILDVTN